MSLYKCKAISFERLLVGPQKILEPLCNTCGTLDCSNPIEPMMVSVFGKNIEWRIYKKSATSPSLVVQCIGYTKKE